MDSKALGLYYGSMIVYMIGSKFYMMNLLAFPKWEIK